MPDQPPVSSVIAVDDADSNAAVVRSPLVHGPGSGSAECVMCSPRNSMQLAGQHGAALAEGAGNGLAAAAHGHVGEGGGGEAHGQRHGDAHGQRHGDAHGQQNGDAHGQQNGNAAEEEEGWAVQWAPKSNPKNTDTHHEDRFHGDEADPLPGSTPARKKGAVLEAFRVLLRSLHAQKHGASVDPTALFRALRGVPGGSDLCDGGQHDCQEVFRVLLDGLHGDLVRGRRLLCGCSQHVRDEAFCIVSVRGIMWIEAIVRGWLCRKKLLLHNVHCTICKSMAQTRVSTQQHEAHSAGEAAPFQIDSAPAAEAPPTDPPTDAMSDMEHAMETEDTKADRLWLQYLRNDDSLMTRLFGGQLQSCVLCHKCSTRFTMYEPFVDLSLPLGREGKGLGWFGSKPPSTIADCLSTFTADELLQVGGMWMSVGGCSVGGCSVGDAGDCDGVVMFFVKNNKQTASLNIYMFPTNPR